MDKPFSPENEAQRIILQALILHAFPTLKLMRELIDEDPQPHLDSMQGRGLTVNNNRGAITSPAEDYRHIFAGLEISGGV